MYNRHFIVLKTAVVTRVWTKEETMVWVGDFLRQFLQELLNSSIVKVVFSYVWKLCLVMCSSFCLFFVRAAHTWIKMFHYTTQGNSPGSQEIPGLSWIPCIISLHFFPSVKFESNLWMECKLLISFSCAKCFKVRWSMPGGSGDTVWEWFCRTAPVPCPHTGEYVVRSTNILMFILQLEQAHSGVKASMPKRRVK